MLIDIEHPTILIARQCKLLELARSSLYYRPSPDDEYNNLLMRLLDEEYTRRPFYGIRKMTQFLIGQGHGVNHKRVARLMRLMGLAAIYPKPRLSAPDKQHRKYPYLLGGLIIDHPNHVWATVGLFESAITYIRMRRGFIYLMAIMEANLRFA